MKIDAGAFLQSDPGKTTYVLLEGKAEILIYDVSFEKYVPGAIVGEITVIDGTPRSATVIAHSQCMLAVVNSR